ncbi:hypothetical protein AVEN_146114-1 [Araneus ventricosus]|uniref:Uncharacterized protein n=1 Tax=Araneus ventricosus TaxID=182803 RepID=A0A4Y2IGT7_ARAVE|nr:hypothetical protein AVEN_146114-1 [Araneus ventricosus]
MSKRAFCYRFVKDPSLLLVDSQLLPAILHKLRRSLCALSVCILISSDQLSLSSKCTTTYLKDFARFIGSRSCEICFGFGVNYKDSRQRRLAGERWMACHAAEPRWMINSTLPDH